MNYEMTDEEYEALSDEYSATPPTLSGKPGIFTQMREEALVRELLDQESARIVIAKSKATGERESTVISKAIRMALL